MRSAAAAISAIAARCDGTRMRARISVIVPADPMRSMEPFRDGRRRWYAEHRAWAPAPASEGESSFESSNMLRHESSPDGSTGAVPLIDASMVHKPSEVRTAPHGFRRRLPCISHSELERDRFFRTFEKEPAGMKYATKNTGGRSL